MAKSNWGKSFTSANPNAENQLVRLHLPEARDLTLYLQPMRDRTGLPATEVDYRVSVGTGGISLVTAWVPTPVVGVSKHYVADSIEVSVITPGASPPAPRIVGANVAIGRPSSLVEPGGRVAALAGAIAGANMPGYLTSRPDTHSWVTVSSGASQLIRIPPFATLVQIRTRANNGAASTEMQVFGVTPSGGVEVSGTLVGDYVEPEPMPPDIVLIELKCTNANPLIHYDALVTFTTSL